MTSPQFLLPQLAYPLLCACSLMLSAVQPEPQTLPLSLDELAAPLAQQGQVPPSSMTCPARA